MARLVTVLSTAFATVLALSACRFNVNGTGAGGDDAAPDVDASHSDLDATIIRDDAGVPIADAAPADATVPEAFCNQNDPMLRACWRFEGLAPGVVALVDDSGNANEGTGTDIGVTAGPTGHGSAISFKTISETFVADSPSLDISDALTLEVWVNPSTTSATRSGVIDNNGQYGLFLSDLGEPRCVIGNVSVTGTPLALVHWSHVACVYDRLNIRVYVDGLEEASVASTVAIPTAGLDGLHLGEDSPDGDDELDGSIDDVRIWAEARTDDQLCAAARPNCF